MFATTIFDTNFKIEGRGENDKGTLPIFHYVRIYKNIVAIVFYID